MKEEAAITVKCSQADELRKLWRAVEQCGSTIIITDRDGNIEFANPRFEELTGYTCDEIRGKKPSILQSGKTPPEVYREMWGKITSGGIWKGELLNKRKDGSLYWGRLTVAPVKDGDGAITHYIGTEEDVTKLHELQEELKDANARLLRSNLELRLFSATVSHDIKGPIAAILMGLDLIWEKNQRTLDSDAAKLIEVMTNKARGLDLLVGDLLNLTRVEMADLEFGPVDLSTVMENVVGNLEDVVREKGGIIQVASLPVVQGDPRMLTQLFQNLIQNGLKFNRSPIPKVEVDCAELEEEYQIFVRDNGVGIPADELKDLFVPFKRASTSDGFGGTGLGLSICRRVAERLHGKIDVSSELGRGTVFTVTMKKSQNERQDGFKAAVGL